MSVHVIKYYRGKDSCVSQFIGDDETVANAMFHLNFYSLLPSDFILTKRNSENKEYALRFVVGGFTWVEVQLDNPLKELTNE